MRGESGGLSSWSKVGCVWPTAQWNVVNRERNSRQTEFFPPSMAERGWVTVLKITVPSHGARCRIDQSKYFYNTRWRGWFPPLRFLFEKAGAGDTAAPSRGSRTYSRMKLKLPDYFCHPLTLNGNGWVTPATAYSVAQWKVRESVEYCWLNLLMMFKEVTHSAFSSDIVPFWCLDMAAKEGVSVDMVTTFFTRLKSSVKLRVNYKTGAQTVTQPPQSNNLGVAGVEKSSRKLWFALEVNGLCKCMVQ